MRAHPTPSTHALRKKSSAALTQIYRSFSNDFPDQSCDMSSSYTKRSDAHTQLMQSGLLLSGDRVDQSDY